VGKSNGYKTFLKELKAENSNEKRDNIKWYDYQAN